MAQSLNLTKPFGFLSLLFGGIRWLEKDKTGPVVILHLYLEQGTTIFPSYAMD